MSDPSTYCPLDHACALPAGHDGRCDLTAGLCFCAECNVVAAAREVVRTADMTAES